ncbi:MAG: transglycosylase SLT domain-containing protein [Acidimicrobiia bacterium]|nr:transglycosylase SLT domain-containing protein [Acidimicrobiia bacterium]
MRVRALSLLLMVGMLVPSVGSASETGTVPIDTTSTTTTDQVRPPARGTTAVSTDSVGPAPLAVASQTGATQEPDPVVPIGRWFGCQPPFGGLCVQDREAAKTVNELMLEWSGSIDDWRPLVEAFFAPGDVSRAMSVIGCESGGDPNAKNRYSTASGLFQHLASYWGDRAVLAGYSGSDVFDPLANVAVAAWLVYDGGGWTHWAASGRCWG